MQTKIIQGHELTEAQIDFMNNQRLTEYGENTKDFKKNERESVFFFLVEADSTKAFGLLKPVGITYADKSYRVLGIANIIAVEKGKGYGKVLMQVIKNYLTSQNMSGIGFCDATVCEFYAKCGYQIIDGLSTRFQYIHGQREKLDAERGVIYFDGGDALISKLLENDDLISTDVPLW